MEAPQREELKTERVDAIRTKPLNDSDAPICAEHTTDRLDPKREKLRNDSAEPK